jgi:glycosyltransferase involved in cell wall biosynthesis
MPDPSAVAINHVTPLILTYNEEANIERILSGLAWAGRIVVVDSGSTDATLDILSTHPRVEIFHREFDTHASQWNFGLSLISSGWVLSLDADYFVTPALSDAIAKSVILAEIDSINGFRIPFRYCVAGKPLRATVLPPRIALFRVGVASYVDDGHTQDLVLAGRCADIRQPILHDDRKRLDRWLWAQQRYIKLESVKLLGMPSRCLSVADRIRMKHIVAPFAIFFLCLVWHRGFLDGWRGWYYAFQRMYAEILLSLMLWDLKTRS